MQSKIELANYPSPETAIEYYWMGIGHDADLYQKVGDDALTSGRALRAISASGTPEW